MPGLLKIKVSYTATSQAWLDRQHQGNLKKKKSGGGGGETGQAERR